MIKVRTHTIRIRTMITHTMKHKWKHIRTVRTVRAQRTNDNNESNQESKSKDDNENQHTQ